MPPKAKFSRGEIIQAALSIVKQDGMSALTARTLGQKLSSSARPIFTVFQNMEEVQQEVLKAAREEYNKYTRKGLSEASAFKEIGMQYIRFARDEPQLFQLLFMLQKHDTSTVDGILALDDYCEEIITSIQTQYNLSRNIAHKLYRHLWIYSHGIATLIATGVCTINDTELREMLTEVFGGIFYKVTSESEE